MAAAPAVGIDLGNTNSCVAVFQKGRVEIITNDHGNRTTPSYIAFADTQRLVGDVAKNQVVGVDPSNTIFDAKRLMGRLFNHPAINSNLKHWPFKVVNNKGKPKIKIEYKGEVKYFCPEEVSSMVLSKMKNIAEAHLGKTVTQAVISVPAHFNFFQRQATKDAGTIAGFQVVRTINETTAAAIAYGLSNKHQHCDEIRNVMIFDLGGSTLDVAIVTIEEGIFEVKSTAGTHLGGEDFDNHLTYHFTQEFLHKHKRDLSSNKRALRRLKTACEKAKRTLSSTSQANIELDSLFEGIDFYTSITRVKFEELTAHIFRSIKDIVEKAVTDSKFNKSNIDDIVLVGGCSRIPKVQKLLQDFFNGKELNKSINPDEAVAYGAAIQAAIITNNKSKEIENLLLLEVTPSSLGFETPAGIMTAVVKRNTPIPIKHTYTTHSDKDTFFSIRIFEGERALAKDNHCLGKFALSGIPVNSAIELSFDVDTDDILTVTAFEPTTKKRNKIIIPHKKHHLSAADIERMINDAQQYQIEDEKLKKTIAAKNSLEAYCFKLQSIAGEKKTDISLFRSIGVRIKCSEIITWLDSDQLATIEEYQQKQRELENIYNRITNNDASASKATTSKSEERQNKTVAAKYNLQTYCCNIRIAVEEMKDKISYSEGCRIMEKCNEVSAWLDSIGSSGAIEDFEGRQKELESLYKSAITKSCNDKVSTNMKVSGNSMSKLEPNDLLHDVKCGKCNKYLSYFPIYIAQNALSICGRCSNFANEENIYIRNTLYESLVGFLKFPCIYHNDGCLEKLLPADIPKHEMECCFRNISCSEGCGWQGTITNLLEHFEEMHPSSIIRSNDKFELNFLNSYETHHLLTFEDQLFSFKQKFNESEVLECSLDCYRSVDNKTEYWYEITVENVFKNISVNFPRKSADNFEDENVTKIVMKDLMNQLKDPSVVVGAINVFSTEDETLEQYNKRGIPEVNYDLLAELECPVCFEYITPPIYQCVTGHSICTECKKQISQCPSCKAEIKNTQNFTLEKMAYLLNYPCKFVDQGCDFAAKPMEIKEHQNTCGHAPCLCPLKDYDDECLWKNSGKHMFSHIINSHDVYVLKGNTINVIMDRNYSRSKDSACYVIKFSDVLFKMHYLYQEDVFYWAVQLIGPPENSKKYKFEIDVVDNNTNDKKLLLRHLCAPLTKKNSCFEVVDTYVFIRLQQIKSFLTDVFTYKIRIIK